ncbi:MAG: methyltransferase domain-containing protein [Nitrospirales bacterium]|nr:methyltransferase domain-containing protein [Nitrospirales bacterium]
MFSAYRDIFQKRGHLYHQAMTLHPQARAEEFHHTVRMADIKNNEIVCDIPSGGGYLRHFVNQTGTLYHMETSQVFADLCKANSASHAFLGTLGSIPLITGSIDTLISLAALHHVDEKKQFFFEAHRILNPGGTLVIADVRAHSAVSEFLDGFVNEHNTMGHKGNYIHAETQEEIERCGFTVKESSLIPFHWQFDSPQAMGQFCRMLFGIDKADSAQVVEGIQKHVGYYVDSNACRMNWELFFIKARKC